jgi:hypothetical protein
MLEKLEIQWHVSKTKQITICLFVLIALQITSVVLAFRAIESIDWNLLSGTGTSYYGIAMRILFWGVLKLAFFISSIVGLQKRLLWGAVSAALIAAMQLFTLCFPISFLIGWYLLPDAVREQISIEVKPLFTKQI